MSQFAIDSYAQSFHVLYDGEPLVELLEERPGGELKLSVTTRWWTDVYRHVLYLTVPTVTPARFPWDNGIYGSLIRMPTTPGRPQARCERFCAPLLVSARADWIARSHPRDRRQLLVHFPEFDFTWISWYGRLQRSVQSALVKLSGGERKPTAALCESTLRNAVVALLARKPDDDDRSIPLTDEALIFRHLHEVELAYPDVIGDTWLYEEIKSRFLASVDAACDVLFTGKNDVGRRVLRVRPDAPLNQHTTRPMPDFATAVSALAPWANPIRDWRENGSCQWLKLKEPLAPPLTLPGVVTPAPLAARITTLNVAIVDVFDRNVFLADTAVAAAVPGVQLGDECSLDGLLATPSGRRKLEAELIQSELMSAEEFLMERPALEKLAGFGCEELPRYAEKLADGTPVYRHEHRWWHTAHRRCLYDKVKLLYGGIKAVTEPVRQVYFQAGDTLLPVDLIVAEDTFWNKYAWVLAAGALAGMAKLGQLDPTWSREQLLDQIARGLAAQGHPEDGLFPLVVKEPAWWIDGRPISEEQALSLRRMGATVREGKVRRVVGRAVCGPVPAVRAVETEVRQSKKNGAVSVNIHGRCLVGIPFPAEPVVVNRVTQLAQFFYRHAKAGLLQEASEE